MYKPIYMNVTICSEQQQSINRKKYIVNKWNQTNENQLLILEFLSSDLFLSRRVEKRQKNEQQKSVKSDLKCKRKSPPNS